MRAGSVRDATFEVLRRRGLTTLFANPGSTEVPFLLDLPDDLRFVLALHEGSVVGMATGFAIGHDEPALALLHTTAGVGNAVGALATARVNRAPLVVLVGQQDRRHLATEPFLAGRIAGIAGEYPVSFEQPVRPQDVPAAIDRAYHEAVASRGPAVVVVPMDDWSEPAGEPHEHAAPARVLRDPGAPGIDELAALLAGAASPALVAGADADDPDAWAALVTLAERLRCPVFQESFGGRAGFPQDHPQFAGHLPADRPRLRELLAPYDVVMAVGAPVFRQYPYHAGPLVGEGTRLAAVVRDPGEAHRSVAELAVVGSPGKVCAALAGRLPQRETPLPEPAHRLDPLLPPGAGEPLRAGHVLQALAERLPRDAVLVEETPSSRPELEKRYAAREPLGFLSAAMGGLGFALPAAVGVRMALPQRPVVAVVGDGSSLYCIQALWSAAHYRVGALFVILSNGGYAVMNRLAEHRSGNGAWPGFSVDVAGIARSLGCASARIEGHDELLVALDGIVPELAAREDPLLLEVVVEQDPEFQP